MTSLVRRLHRPLMQRQLPTLDRMFRNVWLEPFNMERPEITPREGAWAPKVDLYETEEDLVAKVELPGVVKEDVEVVRDDGHLVIRADSKDETDVEEEGYHRCERFHGHYERHIPLPVPVDEERIVAKFEDGILEIRAPKSEPDPEPEEQRIEIL